MRQEILELRYNVDSLIKKYEGNKKWKKQEYIWLVRM
jgi:hypothetical protein